MNRVVVDNEVEMRGGQNGSWHYGQKVCFVYTLEQILVIRLLWRQVFSQRLGNIVVRQLLADDYVHQKHVHVDAIWKISCCNVLETYQQIGIRPLEWQRNKALLFPGGIGSSGGKIPFKLPPPALARNFQELHTTLSLEKTTDDYHSLRPWLFSARGGF